MRKLAMSLAVIVILVLPMTTYAASRSIGIVPNLSFSGTTANCTVKVVADSFAHEIEATIKLWQGSICVATWEEEGKGILSFSDSATVTKDKTYNLTVDAIVNGVVQPQVSVSATCK